MSRKKKAFTGLIIVIIVLLGIVLFYRFYFKGNLENTSVTTNDNKSTFTISHTMSKGNADDLEINICRVKMSDSCEMLEILIGSTDNDSNYKIKNVRTDLQFGGDFIKGFYSNGDTYYRAFGGRGSNSDISTTNSPKGYFDIVLFLNDVEDEKINIDITYDVCGSGLFLFNQFKSISQTVTFPVI